ncbi:MAG TPA: gluconolactonase [Verrucomicrobiales bacterium]|nr:gluconolactonase [Verrucomicrobiales bacterium]
MNSSPLLPLALTLALALSTPAHGEGTKGEKDPTKPAAKSQGKSKLQDYPNLGSIERVDPRLDALLPKEARIEKLAEGFDWSEGPVWIKEGSYLVFSDVPQNKIFKWSEGNPATVFLEPSGYTGSVPRGGEPGSNGLTVDAQGRLVMCEHGDRRVTRLERNGRKTTLARYYKFYRFNSPNDLVFNSKGDLYFTDPPYGLLEKNADPAKELPFCGVYRLKPGDKEPTLIIRDLTFPNGIALSPDEKRLYVAVSDPDKPVITTFDVQPDGTVANGQVFHDFTAQVKAGLKGLPDGMKVDRKGNLFATAPGGVYIFAPDGTHLGTLQTGQATANCNWGNDGSVLYITADKFLCRVRTTTKGKGW